MLERHDTDYDKMRRRGSVFRWSNSLGTYYGFYL
jgi:hypothetical protein